jgi:predicted phosphodiesterase
VIRPRTFAALAVLSLAAALLQPAAANAVTAPPQGSVAVIGDFGSGTDDERRVADLVARAHPAAIVTTGDNVYDDLGYAALVGSYYGPWASSGHMIPAVGNHDHAEGIRAFDEYFPRLRGRHVYSAGAGGIRFFILDSTTALASPAARARQRSWLERSLKASPARWKVVVLHHPPYSSGVAHGPSPALRWPYGAWGADLVLSGHEHNYERLVTDGSTFVVDGSGGKALRPLGDAVPGSQARFDADYGALFLSATDSELTGEFWSAAGDRIDRFVLPRGELAS